MVVKMCFISFMSILQFIFFLLFTAFLEYNEEENEIFQWLPQPCRSDDSVIEIKCGCVSSISV